MTTLEKYCQIKGWQGGTIHQAKEDYLTLSLKEKDKICDILIDSMNEISDLKTVQYFTENRI